MFQRIRSANSALALLSLVVLAVFPAVTGAADQVHDGPFSLSLHGGGRSDSASAGIEARADYINPGINLHLFSLFDWLSDSGPIGAVDEKRIGGGLAISHTFPDRANVYLGTSVLREMDETFSHVYGGLKYKMSGNALVTVSYGAGLTGRKFIPASANTWFEAEAADWLKAGGVVVGHNGLKTKLNYYLTDPGDRNISGVEAEVAYPINPQLTIGLRGSSDITSKSNIERNWQAFGFVNYRFGDGGSVPVLELSLDRNNPIEYPVVLRTEAMNVAPVGGGGDVAALTVSPSTATVVGYTDDSVTLTASGGTPPYSWSASAGFIPAPTSGVSQITWFEDYDFCDPGTATVTVQDSAGGSATATIDLPTTDC